MIIFTKFSSSSSLFSRRISSLAINAGSSPHAWGRCMISLSTIVCSRFIPTCVGQIVFLQARQRLIDGSSPHAWGRSARSASCRPASRFIPTCVGQIATWCGTCTALPGSSPHAWGRFQMNAVNLACSPVHPHMRGADGHFFCNCSIHLRFIPTCVGQISRRELRS